MSFPVSYYCPHCGALVEIEREGYLADKSVTPYPLVGWEYAAPEAEFEGDADGVQFVCGESDAPGLTWTGERSEADDVENPHGDSPCGREFYLSFVRYEDGREVESVPESEYVDIGL
ncbi:hypothetical protein SAMN04488063_1907 [Halopelagius inordinatus]|uniref:DUF7969 domain-containing protein n=1 Tax=Halopelagius inordinatus TaxID=553467 RepID=A0A1I2RLN6_9EURY|nr:hypothetical protein [Halopelagius inordinatus]SFG39537.1 hypothetical protein SAMN04488063_1907 [Halopelagius inordinatus]